MLFLSGEKRDAIAGLCRAYGVKRLDLFGSAATGSFEPGRSDVDLLVDFGDMGGRAKAHAYSDLRDGPREVLGTEVDLVMVAAVKNRYLARDIERTKRPPRALAVRFMWHAHLSWSGRPAPAGGASCTVLT